MLDRFLSLVFIFYTFSLCYFPITFFLLFTPCLSVFSVQHQCMQGAVCPIASASTAYCGACDLDPSTISCTWVLSVHTHPYTLATTHSPSINITVGPSTHTNISDSTYKMADTYSHTYTETLQLEGSLCPSYEEVVYSGDANRYTYTGNLCVFSRTGRNLEKILN